MDTTKHFNEVQLETMRKEFAKIDHIDNEHWKRIRYMIESAPERTSLHQLSAAGIKFLSQIVRHYLKSGVLRRP